VKDIAAEPMAKRVSNIYLSGKADGSPKSAKQWQLLPDCELLLVTSCNEAGCNSYSGGELNNTESDKNNKEPRSIKRKRPSLSQDGLIYKKPKPYLQ
jgi:hypothetical protein